MASRLMVLISASPLHDRRVNGAPTEKIVSSSNFQLTWRRRHRHVFLSLQAYFHSFCSYLGLHLYLAAHIAARILYADYTWGDSGVILFHIYASRSLPPSCR